MDYLPIAMIKVGIECPQVHVHAVVEDFVSLLFITMVPTQM